MSRPALGRNRVQVTLPPALVARLDAEAARREGAQMSDGQASHERASVKS